jgi:hypothetical protein
VLGTVSAADFPAASPPWGVLPYNLAELYNDDQDPLFIVNTNVTSLPPSVVYIHGETTAVPLLFKYNNGSLWSAGDLLGYVTLAGHGVTVPCTDHNPGQPDTNCCAQVPGGSVSAFLDTVLGPVGSPRPSMAVPWVRPTNSFPIPLTSWNSLVNRVGSPSTGTNNLDASVSFGTLGFSLSALTVGLWSNSVAPPSGAASVSQTNIPITFQLWSSGTYFPASGTGVVTMVISNTGSASQSLIYSNPPPVTNYTLQMTSLKSRCTWAGGPLFLRLDTNTASLGQRTIRQNAGSGYRVSDYVDANLQLSTDNINWFNASGPLRLLPSVPPATAKATAPVLTATKIGTNLVLSWSGTWVLQSATSLPATWTDLNEGIPFEGPYTNPISPQKMFFRLRN